MSQERDEPVDIKVAGADEDNGAVMGLLSEHVPLSLIMDLSAPAGPDSVQILEAEGQPDDAWWEPVQTHPQPPASESA